MAEVEIPDYVAPRKPRVEKELVGRKPKRRVGRPRNVVTPRVGPRPDRTTPCLVSISPEAHTLLRLNRSVAGVSMGATLDALVLQALGHLDPSQKPSPRSKPGRRPQKDTK